MTQIETLKREINKLNGDNLDKIETKKKEKETAINKLNSDNRDNIEILKTEKETIINKFNTDNIDNINNLKVKHSKQMEDKKLKTVRNL